MKRSFPIFPWIFFTVFAIANGLLAFAQFDGLLAYAPLKGFVINAIFTIGLALPLGAALFMAAQSKELPAFSLEKDIFKVPPSWVLWLLALVTIFLRFYQLTSLSVWPHEDEAMNGHYAIELAEKGYWQFTYDFSGMPPLYVWGLGLFFKFFGVSLGTLWAFPALLSVLAVGFAYLGMRKFASPSFSFLFALLMAVSFWPLYVARFSVQGGFLIFWECLTFYLLGNYWKKPGIRSSLSLGICAGVGFYTFTSWAVVAFLLTVFFFYATVIQSRRHLDHFLSFFIPEVALFLPIALVSTVHNGGHFQYVYQDPFKGHWIGFNDLFSIFWGSRLGTNLFAYRPFWGGFLNPILGALCFWGIIALGKMKNGFSPWKWAGLFFLLLLPGFLTGGLDSHRIVQVQPFLLFTAVVGLATLGALISTHWRWVVMGGLLFISAGLDYYHLFGVYHSLWTSPRWDVSNYKTLEYARAYEVLDDLHKTQGPGYILCQLVPDTFDQSLAVATHSFNVLQNPDAPPATAHWAALLTNVHYAPYLEKQFPEGKGYWISKDAGRSDGGSLLVLIPLPCPQMNLLQHWIEADQAMAGIVGDVYDNHDWKPRKPILEDLHRMHFLFEGDPFLESCYWEKVAQNEYMDRNYDGQVEAVQQAIAKGIPAAHLYSDLGALYMRRKHWEEARKAFQQAISCKPDLTPARAYFDQFEKFEKMEKDGLMPLD